MNSQSGYFSHFAAGLDFSKYLCYVYVILTSENQRKSRLPMIVFAVCDDDAVFAKILTNHLRRLFVGLPDEIECLAQTFLSSEQVLRYIEKKSIHILFLDIDMPGKNGFELAKILQKKSPSTIIVFVSAYDSYVYDSFRFSPFCFLRKTHLKEELNDTVQRVLKKFLESSETMVFSTVYGDVKLRIQDIVYIESVKNYYEIHCDEKSVFRCRGTITSAEAAISKYSFYRIHTAFLINMENIRLVGANREIEMTDGTRHFVSLRKWKGFYEAYMNFSRKRVLLT